MVKNIWRNGSVIFSKKQSNILSAATVIMMAVFISRLLGLLRDRLLAAYFFGGNEWQLDVYFAAFRIPDMIFQLLVMGAFSAAFIPVFSHFLFQKKENQAWEICSSTLNISLFLFLLIASVAFVFASSMSQIIAPNFNIIQQNLMASLVRLMLFAQFFFIISTFLTGILHSFQRFLLPAFAPVIYNFGIIFGTIFLSSKFGIYGPVYGVILGAFLHFLIQLPLSLKLGFVWQPKINLRHPGVIKIGRLMLPRTLALAVNQIELTIAVFIATSLSAGSLTIFYFAQHLNNLPVGLFGNTIGQAALPVLSSQSAQNQRDLFKKTFLQSFYQILYLAFPASIILLVLRIPIVRIVFGAKQFPWQATILTGKVLAIFSLSVFCQCLLPFLMRTFYAILDTKTPFFISAISVGLSVILSFLFVFRFSFGLLGLAMAITLASIFQAFMLLFLLNRKEIINFQQTFIPIFKIILATLITGVFLWIPMKLLDRFILDTTRTINLLILTIIAAGTGLAVYFFLSYILKIEQFSEFFSLARKLGRWREVLGETEEIMETSPLS